MKIGRRALLGTGLAAVAVLAGGGRARASRPALLRAAPARVQLAPEGYSETEVWAYEGRVPGPEISVPRGGRVHRHLINELPQPTAVHWHGIRIDNAMDGVPGMTQKAVDPGQGFVYEFTVPDAGTYWYHTHNRSWEQLARGLAGPLIVREDAPPDTDADITVALNDWRLTREAALAGDFGNLHDFSHAGRIGNLVTVNGAFEMQRPAARHERLRLRLINMATARVLTLGFDGLEGWIVALDGMPLARPEPLGEVTLAPAQRADVIVDVTAEAGGEAVIYHRVRDGGFALAVFAVGPGTRARRPAPGALPPNALPALDLGGARRLALRMEGGAMRGLPGGAEFEGRQMDMPALVERGQVWAFNGVAGMAEAPLFGLARGETIRLDLVNDTAFPHAIHLHGHHFREIRADGPGPWRDTTLVAPGATAPIVLAGDNPGDWLLHCHMLGHQASGMKTWFRVG
jgi:FtsP/CotA-like multicopper oxidase with cupredoxin domain